MAGGAAFTLTVNGSRFMANSVVRWNGVNRPTTLVNATQLQASIGAADIAAAGTANVTVFTPAPGGGASAPVPFTIRGLPALTVSTTSVAGGSPLTVTLTDGLGGTSDWLALAVAGAPNNSYVQFTYVGQGVTTRTWTATAPATPGTYEFRLFENNGYTRLATSPVVTVLPGPPVISSLSPAAAAVGGAAFTLTVDGSAFTSGSIVRWNGANRVTTFSGPTRLLASIPATDLTTVGTAQVTVFDPSSGKTSSAAPFAIQAAPVLSVSSTTVTTGTTVTVTLTGGFGGASDWLAFANTGAPVNSYLQYTYVGGVATRTWTVMVTTPGTYEFRLFLNNGYTLAATSPTITATAGAPPTLTVSTTTAAPGTPVTVTLANGYGGGTDWLALAQTVPRSTTTCSSRTSAAA
jgi:hypothetical protein